MKFSHNILRTIKELTTKHVETMKDIILAQTNSHCDFKYTYTNQPIKFARKMQIKGKYRFFHLIKYTPVDVKNNIFTYFNKKKCIIALHIDS